MGSRGSKSRSSKSSRSGNVSSRSSIKDKSIEEKIKVIELIVESSFNEQKLKIKYEAKRLEIEKVAKTKVVNLLDMPPLEGEEDVKEKNIVYRNHMMDANVALDTQYENWKEFKPGKKSYYINS